MASRAMPRCAGQFRGLVAGLTTWLWLGGCGGGILPSNTPTVEPSRGYLLISLSGLRTDRLGCYGAASSSTPVLDALATRGSLFKRAITQHPSSLTSHLSMLTGLYPAEHAVYPPFDRLSPDLELLPERLASYGFRTAGFSQGALLSADFGLDRGFDVYENAPRADAEALDPWQRAEEFLSGMQPRDRFFVFLHDRSLDLLAVNAAAVNAGFTQLDAPEITRLSAAYDRTVTELDARLGGFLEHLDTLGLSAETTLIVTADHGFELLEHGKLVNAQVYPETTHVPLLIVRPDAETERRIAQPVESLDLAATLYDLAGLPQPAVQSGQSLVPLMAGSEDPADSETRTAYSESLRNPVHQSLVVHDTAGLYQLIKTTYRSERDGTWISREGSFDVTEDAPVHRLRMASFHQPTEIEISIDGEVTDRRTIPTRWVSVPLDLPASGRHRVGIDAAACRSPQAVGQGDDSRCLSVKIRGALLARSELFDLSDDPGARRDVSRHHPDVLAELETRLEAHRWRPRAAPLLSRTTGAIFEDLKALGYMR